MNLPSGQSILLVATETELSNPWSLPQGTAGRPITKQGMTGAKTGKECI